jgi:hypothetical protein
MSVQAMSQVWLLKLHPTQKFVLLALADHANEKNICWPGLDKLVEKTGFVRSTVIDAIKQLKKAGILSSRPIHGEKGFRKGTEYKLYLSQNLSPPSLSRLELSGIEESLSLNKALPESESQPQTIKEPLKNHKYNKSLLPNDFDLNDELLAWGRKEGYLEQILKQHLEHFKNIAQAKGYQYVNWDAAFKAAVKKNWARIENEGKGSAPIIRKWAHEQPMVDIEPISPERRGEILSQLPAYLRKIG